MTRSESEPEEGGEAPPLHERLATLKEAIEATVLADRPGFRRRWQGLKRRFDRHESVSEHGFQALHRDVQASLTRVERRLGALPRTTYPADLPVVEQADAVRQAIAEHQVVILCGETGSGKTTQLPKLCLDLGRGVRGFVGHTQPRRIAARTVANRIAGELETELGHAVGYKIRFTDRVGPEGYIKLMTDGILLAEIQADPYLDHYDTLIIDEAHERSLNIDFLLGYLKRLLPKRRDLKLILASATIDPERFARHFDEAPIVNVSGRTYPVEIRYRPPAGRDEDSRAQDQPRAILEAVDELAAEGPGDILVFLATEREIRETAEALRKHHPPGTEVLPLFARLSAAEQNRVFQPHGGRRIVLATNVAETSLTVPGIRYVIDPGYARISRYSHRSKVQRLPIEPIAQASANQRTGRCGRLGPGVCIRLYSEADFENRPAFTEPEILRTNLAAVILQMTHLGLGAIREFPFVDPPDHRLIQDGFRLLFELGAVDGEHQLTELGRRLARLPVDPRLGRMILAGHEHGCLPEVLVVVSALSINDPRERPADKEAAADAAHRRFQDERSDFIAYLNLWRYYQEAARHRSRNKLRELCQQEFLSGLRMREWHEIHQQLQGQLHDMGLLKDERSPRSAEELDKGGGYAQLHQAVLTGLLGQIGLREDDKAYLGARHRRFQIFPGSALRKKGPKWIMAAELVETRRVFARTVARIDPEWVEPAAQHLLHREYLEPHWDPEQGKVMAYEKVTLYGLILRSRKRVHYGPINPAVARILFIQEGLIGGRYPVEAPFIVHNRAQVEEVEALEAKSRRRDLLVPPETLEAFYAERLPSDVYTVQALESWRRAAEKADPSILHLRREDLMQHDAAGISGARFPDQLSTVGVTLPLRYHFEPGSEADGVTVVVPLPVLNQLRPERFTWLVPGLLEEKITLLIKALPKYLRRNFVPAPDFARACFEALAPADDRALEPALSEQLKRMTGVDVPPDVWSSAGLADHLIMRFHVVDTAGEMVAVGRDLEALKTELSAEATASFQRREPLSWERDDVRDWDFDQLPETVTYTTAGVEVQGYPALVAEDDRVALRLLDDPDRARQQTRGGLRRLYLLRAGEARRRLQRNLPRIQALCLKYAPIGRCDDLRRDLLERAADEAFATEVLPEDRSAFEERLKAGRARLESTAQSIAERLDDVLERNARVRQRLKGNLPLSWIEAAADIDDQLRHLIYPGFVLDTPAEWFPHLPRYLEGIEKRLEKLDREPDRDRMRRGEVLALWENYKAHAVKANGALTPEIAAFRWYIEELRVQMFAQELGTSVNISRKRLDKHWNAMMRGGG